MAAEYEIVKRLRGCQSEEDDRAHQDGIIPSEIFGEAAATIVALAEALKPFAKHGAYLEEQNLDGHVVHTGPFTFDDFRRARSALGGV